MENNRHNILLKFAFLFVFFPIHFFLNVRSSSYADVSNHASSIFFVSFITTIFTLFLMAFFQVFRTYRFFPRKSDPVIVMLLILVSEAVASSMMHGLGDLPFPSLIMLILRALLLSSAWYGIHMILALSLKALGYRLNILFLGREQDLRALNNSLKSTFYKDIFKFNMWREGMPSSNTDLVVYSPSCNDDETLKYNLIQLTIANRHVMDVRDLVEEIEYHVDLDGHDDKDILKWAQELPPSSKFYLRLKSVVEPTVAFLMLVALSPIMLLTAIAVKLSSPGPILFKQRRLGLGGKSFSILKFRTMRTDAEKAGAQWAQRNDPRVTSIGKTLRILHLDELPQLFNIISGDVSFVGPRPERPEFYDQLKNRIPLFYLRTVIRPGVTGWAQVWAGYAASLEESSLKLSYDLYYMKKMGLRMDVISVILTFVHVVRKLFLSEESLATGKEVELSLPISSSASTAFSFGKKTLFFLILTTLALSVTSIAFG
jgi:lipopolysaccharide/colanic/teichoic acid biosynthesis glycosyltransferase